MSAKKANSKIEGTAALVRQGCDKAVMRPEPLEYGYTCPECGTRWLMMLMGDAKWCPECEVKRQRWFGLVNAL